MSPAVPEPEEPRGGEIAPVVAEEFPALRLRWLLVPRGSGRTPRAVKARLRTLSDRIGGARAISLRQQPVPQAYRVFFRQVGLDPDADRPPQEAAVLERLVAGHFRSQNLLDDALTISLVETGVPVWALDADVVRGAPRVRPAQPGERLGRGPEMRAVPPGRLVVADDEGPVAIIFGDVAPGCGVTKATRRMVLFALGVAGVPAIHVEEALHGCASLLLEG